MTEKTMEPETTKDADRAVWLIDRWGATWEDGITLERFAELFDDLDPEDDEHGVVGIEDEHGWGVELSATTAAFGNAEERIELGSVALADRADALAIAAEFLGGDFAALRRRPWAEASS